MRQGLVTMLRLAGKSPSCCVVILLSPGVNYKRQPPHTARFFFIWKDFTKFQDLKSKKNFRSNIQHLRSFGSKAQKRKFCILNQITVEINASYFHGFLRLKSLAKLFSLFFYEIKNQICLKNILKGRSWLERWLNTLQEDSSLVLNIYTRHLKSTLRDQTPSSGFHRHEWGIHSLIFSHIL